MKTALRLLLAPYRFSVDRLFRMGEIGGAHWFTDPNTLYRRRNRLTYTRDFSNAAWARTRILSVTADADGVGDLVVPDATPSTHAINQQSAVTAGATTTYVVRAKPGGYDFVILSLGSSSLAYFDLSAGTVGTTSNAISTSIAAAADAPGYYDCTLVGIPNSTNCFIYAAQTDGVVAFAGDGTSGVYFARAQLETYTTTATEYQDVPTTWPEAYLAAVGAENIYAWTDSAGTTPVTAVGQTIGLSLDRAYGGMRGVELCAYSSGFPNTTGITVASATVALVGSALEVTATGSAGGNYALIPVVSGITVGKVYEVRMRVRRGAQGTQQVVAVFTFATITTRAITNSGTFTEISWRVVATATSGSLRLYAADAAGAVGDSVLAETISIREVPGTHLIQATGTARPTLSARVNAFTYTEQFDNAAWAKTNCTVTANQAVSPDSQTTADKLIPNNLATDARVQQNISGGVSGAGYVYQVYAKAAELSNFRIYADDGASNVASISYNLSTGAISTALSSAGWTSVSSSISDVGNGWWRIVLRWTATGGAPTRAQCWCRDTGNGTGGIYVWGADLRTADDAAKNLPAYQRVGATAADHDTEGFPHGQYPDGTDDNQTTTTGGGGTTGFFYCGAITVSGGAGTARTIWSDTGTNTGYRVRINSSNKLELAAGNGSAYTTVESNETITAPGTYILSAWDDGGVLAVQVNNFAAATTTRPTVSAGTSTATMYKDNDAASSYLNGRDYGSVYRQSYIGESQHARLKRWLADRARITL